MKNYQLYIIIAGLFASANLYSQTSLKDFVGVPLDSAQVKTLVLDSTKVERIQVKLKSARMYGEPLHPQIPTTYAIDKSKDVGEIPFTSTISPIGAMSINVPIDVFPEPKGLTPQVSLAYNSSGNNSSLGFGWSLSGLSTISRTNKSIYYDGKTEGIKSYAAESAYLLDGSRLIVKSQTSAQVEFESEQGKIKVIGYLNGTNMHYFEVFYPDGKRAIYGQATSSYTYGHPISYPLEKITDRTGNQINYSYSNINGHHRLNKITYGQNQSAMVEFAYTSTRPGADIQEIFSAGQKIIYDYVLNTVSTKLNSAALKTYTINYTSKGKVTLIDRINLTASGRSFNPLIFYYGDNKQITGYKKEDTQLMHWYNFTNPSDIRFTKGKFDYGSENDGIITLPNKAHYVEYWKKAGVFNHSENRIQNQYSGDETIIVATGLSGELGSYNPILKTEAGFVDIFCMDIDDFDGEEIIKVNNTVSGNYDKIDFHVFTPNLYAGIVEKYTRSFQFNTLLDHRGEKSINPKFYFTGDFDGDGKMEVLVVSSYNAMDKGAPTQCYLFDLEGNKKLYEGHPFNYWVQLPKIGSSSVSGEDAYRNSDKIYTSSYV